MPIINFQQIKCPSCGYTMTSESLPVHKADCPFCGQQIFGPQVSSISARLADSVLPVGIDGEQFREEMAKHLVEQEFVPTNIFECINTRNICRVYIPMYLYRGTYAARWNCQTAHDVKENVRDKNGTVSTQTVRHWEPSTGDIKQNFVHLVIAYEGKELPREVLDFCSSYDMGNGTFFDMDQSLLHSTDEKKVLVLTPNLEPSTVWKSRILPKLAEDAKQRMREGLAGQKTRNSTCAITDTSMISNGSCILVPYWIIYYQYKNCPQYFLMDGKGDHHAMSCPVDEEQENTVIRLQQQRIFSAACLFLGLPFFFMGALVGVLVLIIMGGMWYMYSRMLTQRIATYHEQCRQRRQESARTRFALDTNWVPDAQLVDEDGSRPLLESKELK